jgi:CrcB protein
MIGFLSRLAEGQDIITAEARAFIFVGVLGGFMTFSSFGNETVDLWRGGKELSTIAYVSGHLMVGLGAVWLGRALAHQIR